MLAGRGVRPHDRPTLGAAFEEDEDAVDAGDVVGPEKVYQRLILVCALTDLKACEKMTELAATRRMKSNWGNGRRRGGLVKSPRLMWARSEAWIDEKT